MNNFTKAGIVLVFLLFLFFGFFFLDIPSVKSDELWETSRAYYLKNNLHPGEPLLPKEIAPFFATIQELGWKSWFIGSLKFGSSAMLMKILPLDPLHANRMNGFLWSLSVCLFTYLLARKAGLNKWYSLLCVAVLMALPEFFHQVHRERAEMLICSLLLLGLLMLIKSFEAQDLTKKRWWLLATGLFAWLPSMLVHASAIVIPATIGILYLLKERRKIISLNTIIVGIGLAGGLLFFFYIKNAMGAYAISQGGSDFYSAHACPPVICDGPGYILHLPAVFYNKFVKANAWSQPISALFFVLTAGYLVLLIWKRRKDTSNEKNIFLITSIAVPLLIMLLLSGSYGNYNLIVAPFVVIASVLFFHQKAAIVNSPAMGILISLILCILLTTNVIGMKSQYEATQEYKRINEELRKSIPVSANVMGMSLYYLPFRDQHYYSVTWFEPSVGRANLSFEEAVRIEKINYIIADDAFASRANFRGKKWADSLWEFLNSNATMIRQIDTRMYLKIIPDSTLIPLQFRYAEFERSYVKRIRVYEINRINILK
ncbi:hypothetical protein BH11BAC1_BH11BAC1_23160 [soil metagenome]